MLQIPEDTAGHHIPVLNLQSLLPIPYSYETHPLYKTISLIGGQRASLLRRQNFLTCSSAYFVIKVTRHLTDILLLTDTNYEENRSEDKTNVGFN